MHNRFFQREGGLRIEKGGQVPGKQTERADLDGDLFIVDVVDVVADEVVSWDDGRTGTRRTRGAEGGAAIEEGTGACGFCGGVAGWEVAGVGEGYERRESDLE